MNTQDRDNVYRTILNLFHSHTEQAQRTGDELAAYHSNAAQCLYRAAICVLKTLFPAGELSTQELYDDLAAENTKMFFRKE